MEQKGSSCANAYTKLCKTPSSRVQNRGREDGQVMHQESNVSTGKAMHSAALVSPPTHNTEGSCTPTRPVATAAPPTHEGPSTNALASMHDALDSAQSAARPSATAHFQTNSPLLQPDTSNGLPYTSSDAPTLPDSELNTAPPTSGPRRP